MCLQAQMLPQQTDRSDCLSFTCSARPKTATRNTWSKRRRCPTSTVQGTRLRRNTRSIAEKEVICHTRNGVSVPYNIAPLLSRSRTGMPAKPHWFRSVQFASLEASDHVEQNNLYTPCCFINICKFGTSAHIFCIHIIVTMIVPCSDAQCVSVCKFTSLGQSK